MGSSSRNPGDQVEVEVVFAAPDGYAARGDLVVRHPKFAPLPLEPAKKEK